MWSLWNCNDSYLCTKFRASMVTKPRSHRYTISIDVSKYKDTWSSVPFVPKLVHVCEFLGLYRHWLLTTGPPCHKCAPTCLKTESKLARHMAAMPLRHPYFSVYGQRQTCNFNQHLRGLYNKKMLWNIGGKVVTNNCNVESARKLTVVQPRERWRHRTKKKWKKFLSINVSNKKLL